MADGVALIAGGLEALLQGLGVSATRIAVRVLLPPPAADGIRTCSSGWVLLLTAAVNTFQKRVCVATNLMPSLQPWGASRLANRHQM